MSNVLKSHLVRIGNSRGVRIPKLWVEQLALDEAVEMRVEGERLVIRSAPRPRRAGRSSFCAMHECGDDRPMEGVPASTWDAEEWEY